MENHSRANAVFAVAVAVAVAVSGCSATAPHEPTATDYRAFSDEWVQLMAKGDRDSGSVDLKSFWSDNKELVVETADTTCRVTLKAKSRDEALRLVDASVAVAQQNGSDRRSALVLVDASISAAREHICPQYDNRASQVLAYLATQIAVEG